MIPKQYHSTPRVFHYHFVSLGFYPLKTAKGPNYAVAPGETLGEVIESLSMTQKELATITGMTEQAIICILKGSQPITFETANKLEIVTGIPARMWNNLEMQYREQLRKI